MIRTLSRYRLVSLVFAACLLISWFLASRAYRGYAEKEHLNISAEAVERIHAIQDLLKNQLDLLQSTGAFFRASQNVDPDEFEIFTSSILGDRTEIHNLQWVPLVSAGERRAFEAEAGKGLGLLFEIKELDAAGAVVRAGERAVHYPILYTQPLEGNQILLGYDHASDPERFRRLEEARKSRRWAVVPGILAGDGVKDLKHQAFLVFEPIYRAGPPAEAGGGSFAGFVVGVYRAESLFDKAVGDQSSLHRCDMLLAIRDVSDENRPNMIYARDLSGKGREAFLAKLVFDAGYEDRIAREIAFGDREWQIAAVWAENRGRLLVQSGAAMIFGLGFVFSALVAAYLTAMVRHTKQREKLVDQLKDSESRGRLIIETANDAYISIDISGRVLDWNRAAESVFGWKKSEVIGKELSGLIIPESFRGAHRKGIETYLATGKGPVLNQRIEIEALHRNGKTFPVELTVWAAHHGRSVIFNAFVHDITARKEAENRILKNTQFIQVLRNVALAVNQSASSEQALQACLKEICDLMGWPIGHVYRAAENEPDLLLPTPIWFFREQGRYEKFRQVTESMPFAKGVGLPGRILASKKPIWVPNVQKDDNFPRNKAVPDISVKSGMGFPIMVGDRVVGVLEFFSENEEPESPEMLAIMAQLGSQLGRAIEREESENRLKKAFKEISDSHAELKLTQRQLIQADRLSSIGQLAAGVAHEINNPIGFVNSNISTLKKYAAALTRLQDSLKPLFEAARNPESADRIRELAAASAQTAAEARIEFILADITPLIEESQSGLDRVKKIVLDLKTFARADRDEGMDFVDISQVAEGAINMVWNEIKYKAQVVREYGPSVPKVRCNPQQLGQVFINMLVNGSQAIKASGTITVRTYARQEQVCIDIEDTGEGIPENVIDHIFDPFFTTKAVGQGTGLGLGISYDIIKKHHGRIEVASKVGAGTRFTIILPQGPAAQ